MGAERKRIVYTRSATGCHEVVSHKVNNSGYAYVMIDGEHESLHRWIYEKINGAIPEGLIIRHKCDNPRCINIEHLETGTHHDNNIDTLLRGRNPRVKLTATLVREIRASTLSDIELAEKYCVHRSTICRIRLDKIWKCILPKETVYA